MKQFHLKKFQQQVVDAVQNAVERRQNNIIVEMPLQSGKTLVCIKTIEMLKNYYEGNILIVTRATILKKQFMQSLNAYYQENSRAIPGGIIIETRQHLSKLPQDVVSSCRVVVFCDIDVSNEIYEQLGGEEKIIIVFSSSKAVSDHSPFSREDIVYTYSYAEAVNDGFLTPAMDAKALEPTIEKFCREIMVQFQYEVDDSCAAHDIDEKNHEWDLVVKNNDKRLWIECKIYKSQILSAATANEILYDTVLRRKKQNLSQQDYVLLIVLSKIPSFQKQEIYDRHHILVWDINNLVFYCQNSPALLEQLSQLTYFPIDHIEGQRSEQAEQFGLDFDPASIQITADAEQENVSANILIERLTTCISGRDQFREYEKICEDILRFLFESKYFNRLTSQHRTNDAHFRMDLIGSLKVSQNDTDSMHPLWQMLVQHFNSHFIVFEFKNYKDEIDQNLIYITEKYLFNPALRNVAMIISHKGFSDSAKFAAEGCLKEHGKLILNITDEDLIEMLNLKSDKAADYLLEKLENFLMEISK